MSFVSFWQNPHGRRMPPYVALALVSMRRALGTDFVLLREADLTAALGSTVNDKDWRFGELEFAGNADALSIVAKSDFIRMAYVHRHGGYWFDADTIALVDPRPHLIVGHLDDRLHWYSEALFGARPGNTLLAAAIEACHRADRQAWGNPGGIRDIIDLNPAKITPIPYTLLDPGYHPAYRFTTCDVMLNTEMPVERFLANSSAVLLKLYNTYFSRTPIGTMSVTEFLTSGTLLARIFLHIDPNAEQWITHCQALEREIVGAAANP